MSRAARLFSLAQFLRARGGRTMAEIEREFGVSQRTVFRDLASLEETGVPIAFEEGRYRILDARPQPLAFDSGEVTLLRVALSNPALRTGGPLGRRLMALVEKLEVALRGDRPPPALQVLSGPDASGDRTQSAIAELDQLARRGRPARIVYQSLAGNETSERGVDPWRIFHRAGAWYLVGRCHVHDEPRLFRVDRIHGVSSGQGSFEVPADFDVERFLSDAWSVYVGAARHDVRLRFDAELAALIENANHHPGETKERLPDGTIAYGVSIASLEEIARWVVGFGGACRVIGPTELKVRVRQLASGVLASEWRRGAAAERRRSS